MNALDSSLETLTLRQINLNPLLAAAFSNLWALLAVVAAAATYHFRRLRSPKPPPSSSSPPPPETSKPVVPELERSTSNKEVFTVYYHDNDESNDVNDVLYDADFNDEDEDEDEEIETVEEKPIRGGEFGWYDFQDRRVIDGSVVKLWGGDFERSSSSSTSLRSCCSFRRVHSINSNNGNNINNNSLRRCCSLGITPFSFGLI